jgi:hypothetical protein
MRARQIDTFAFPIESHDFYDVDAPPLAGPIEHRASRRLALQPELLAVCDDSRVGACDQPQR